MPRRRTKGPDPINIHVGGRMRMRRMMLGVSQAKLADAFGLTFQQVQKYEKGINRMGSREEFFEVPISLSAALRSRRG
jgi:transcriptional regulator with XRE-family HTH domain